MLQTNISGHRGSHHPIGEALLLLAGIIVLIASGDALAILAATAVIVTAVWWMIREIEHRVRDHAKPAPVIHLRSASTSQRNPKNTPAHVPWRGPSAA